jgi:sodium-dependent dicarboxylate transporter 2/3/5
VAGVKLGAWRLGVGRLSALLAGLAAFALLLGLDGPLHRLPGLGSRPALAAAVTALMAIWWLSEALPIHWTACVPLVVYPFSDVFSPDPLRNAQGVLLPYLDPYIFLFLGGMCIAAAMQQWNLHRRIALTIMRGIGTDPRRLLFGVLAATAFVSLWISNTATAAMMLPIGLSVIAQLETHAGGRRLEHYGAALMLAVAYAANVGGIGTKIGTAPNAQFASFLAQRGIEISFLEYMAVGLPFVLLFLPVAWLALWRIGRRDAPDAEAGRGVLRAEIAELGRMKREEWVVLVVFLVAAALWITGQPLTAWLKPRVAAWIALRSAHVEAGIAMGAAALLTLLRSRGRSVLELRSVRRIPFETLLLLGGSLAMASAIEASGLSAWLAGRLSGLREAPAWAQLLLASLATVALSAVASNVATIAVMLPVLASSVAPSIATTALFTATVAASCDFALPAGTPPNAIVFGSGYVSVPRMAKTGCVLDLLAALLATVLCALLVPWMI